MVDVAPYDNGISKPYVTAGYRGKLGQGFHRNGALTHVFKKRHKLHLAQEKSTRFVNFAFIDKSLQIRILIFTVDISVWVTSMYGGHV